MFTRGEHCDGPWHYLDTVLAVGIGAALTPSDQELDPSGSQNQFSRLNMCQPLGGEGEGLTGVILLFIPGLCRALAKPHSPSTADFTKDNSP